MTTVNTKYAIDLSNEGVSLWCRDKIAAWKLVGKVALNAPDFAEQIEALKNGQTPSEDGRFKAQIRIPASEVFVSEIDLKGAVGDALTKRIKSFLEENTPYKYDDLVFDHVDKSGNGKAYIAAVTKETISEATRAYGVDGDSGVWSRKPNSGVGLFSSPHSSRRPGVNQLTRVQASVRHFPVCGTNGGMIINSPSPKV